MKNCPYYKKLFDTYPDVVTLPEFREMLGGIGTPPQGSSCVEIMAALLHQAYISNPKDKRY